MEFGPGMVVGDIVWFTNLVVHQTLSFWVFMKVSLHRHHWLIVSHCIHSTCSPLPSSESEDGTDSSDCQWLVPLATTLTGRCFPKVTSFIKDKIQGL